MIHRYERGFTLIELMVSMVVGGLLMAGLVALSGAVQKSYSNTREVSDLNTNLRFAMRKITEDFSRIGFMYPLDPTDPNYSCDTQVLPQNLPASWHNWQAFYFDPNAYRFELRGNFLSTRDYRAEINNNSSLTILCRDGGVYDSSSNPGSCSSYPGTDMRILPFLLPFYDGSSFKDLFVRDQFFRMEVSANKYSYHSITDSDPASNTVTFTPPLNLNAIRGFGGDSNAKYLNPIGTVVYQVFQNNAYNRVYPTGTAASYNWVIRRTWATGSVANTVDVAEFVLPANQALQVSMIRDQNPNAGRCGNPWQPTIAGNSDNFTAPTDINTIAGLRGLVITLRGRTEYEDPNYTMSSLDLPTGVDYGVDLDGTPENGLAHVRTEHRVVELKNFAYTARGL